MQIEKNIVLDNAANISFLGINNANLSPIEQKLNIFIVQRGTKFVLRGQQDNVDVAEKILIEMSNTLKLKGEVSLDDVNNIIDLLYFTSDKQIQNLNPDVILYTKDGVIKPKTKNQKKFVEAVRKNDIVFAIGPLVLVKHILRLP